MKSPLDIRNPLKTSRSVASDRVDLTARRTDASPLGSSARMGGRLPGRERFGMSSQSGKYAAELRRRAKAQEKLSAYMDRKGERYARRGQDLYKRAMRSNINKENYRRGAEAHVRRSASLGTQDTEAFSRAKRSEFGFTSQQEFRKSPYSDPNQTYTKGSGRTGQQKKVKRFIYGRDRIESVLYEDGTQIPYDRFIRENQPQVAMPAHSGAKPSAQRDPYRTLGAV